MQTGGAAGTLAAGTVLLTALTLPARAGRGALSPFDLADRLAAGLGLAPVPAPWHTNRLAVTALGDALAAVTDAAGKIAADVLFLSRPEVAELAEPRAAGRGVSSAMPQKQNPVLSVLIRSAALQAPGAGRPAAPRGRQLQRRTPRRRLAQRMGGPAPAAPPGPRRRRCSCANWPKAWRSSPARCAATWTSPARCCSPKPSCAAVAPLLDRTVAARDGAVGRPDRASSGCRPSWTKRSGPRLRSRQPPTGRLLRAAVPEELLTRRPA